MANGESTDEALVVSSQMPVVDANLPKQASKKNTLILLILLTVSITAVAIAVVFSRNSRPQKSDIKTALPLPTPPVDLKVEYQNPFDKSAQYENPFENLK